MASSSRVLCSVFFVLVAVSAACASSVTAPSPPPAASTTQVVEEPDAGTDAEAVPDAAPVASSEPPPPKPKKEGPCPDDMVFVDGKYCPNEQLERRCLKSEYNKPNHLTLCHEFAPKTVCKGGEEPRQFCIDKYEYPNKEGAHPPWMVSWYDGEATCRSLGKRLCYETEWVTACEGPDRTPFPYGYKRDNTKCNIDNTYISPKKNAAKAMLMYHHDPKISGPELARLDQSVASGAMPDCKSGYGVHDLTGNFDEWVTNDHPPEAKSEWAGLKGGAWGHVRNACRPMTTSHTPDFTYYFVSFRCCSDAKGYPVYRPTKSKPAPSVKAEDKAPIPAPENRSGPSKTKVPAVYSSAP